MAHRIIGDRGLPLVLIHGWCCDQDFWRSQIEALAGRFRVVTLDLAGHGLSRAFAEARSLSMTALAADVLVLIDALGIDDFAVLGHSMGGAVAVEVAIAAGSRCRMVLGVDTFDDAGFYACRPNEEIAERRRIFERDFAGSMAAMLDRIVAPPADPALVRWIAEAMSAMDAATALTVLGELLAWDIESRWPRLACPVETINSALLAQRNVSIELEGLVVHRMESVGHFPMLENAAAFNERAIAILQRRLPA